MPSSIEIYSITVTNTNIGNASPNDGFINPQPITGYGVSYGTTPANFNIALSTANRRGNLRYREVINQLHMVANCYVIPESFTAPNATILVQAASLSFKMWVERGGSMQTRDELNPGVVLTGVDAIERCIARAMIADLSHRVIDVFDPTSRISVPAGTTNVPRNGVTIGPATGFSCGPYYGDGNPAHLATNINGAAGLVTVTPFVF